MENEMFEMSALELSNAIKTKKLAVAEVVNAYINHIEKTDKSLNAFLELAKNKAIACAKEVQAKIDSGESLSSLAGVPIAIKDNISTAGVKTTCASKMLGNYSPVFNASVVDRLEKAGMIVLGKLNMDEFAMGGSSETGVFGPVHNPWDVQRVAGGSSGGSAAAVASGEIPLALGSDTGGSIRQPCAFCGTTGIKPTYGSVSRYGLIAYASSLDQIGPVGKSIDDCAALLSIICGSDSKDSTCVISKPFCFGKAHEERLDGVKIGLPRNYFSNGIDEEVKTAVLAAAKEFEAAGAQVEEFDMPLMDYMINAYYVIACAEASSNLSRYDGLKYGYRSPDAKTLSEVYRLSRNEGFGLEVKRRIMIGSFVLSSGYYDAYYKKALQTRALIKDAYNSLFKRFDMLLSPVAPTTAYKLGENIDDPLKMYMGDIYTVSVNLAGLPAAAFPCGFDGQGMPIGFQLIGDMFSEEKLVKAGQVYQLRTDYHKKKPEN
ncbi:MAG: Asp-tRNA(Asn)/Glu-tRNA(Gln) amidotransferase subunit GatA [Fibromonadaceae bacterium]|jgi:aspartyl-tRNA(Asn)/glutamyl-tRNA(Gln) amidotransferase subunit A|nr:Asp-tRNA(Asn)/Glu-tRNA(Gln) amidotransferase subunit GatA [Fibromonadaceae bacterium]